MNLQALSDQQIAALVRIAKTRGRAFFAHPKAMIELRNEHQRRMSDGKPNQVLRDRRQREEAHPE